MSNMKSKKMMKSTNILNQRRFKAKKSLKTNFRSNWIEKEEDDDDDSTIDLKFIDRNQDRDSLQIENLQRLSTMKHLIFLDLENFSSFFQHLTQPLPMLTYVMAFQGIHFQWKPPIKFHNDDFLLLISKELSFVCSHSIFDSLVKSKEFQLMYPSGSRHDAADFALVLSVIVIYFALLVY